MSKRKVLSMAFGLLLLSAGVAISCLLIAPSPPTELLNQGRRALAQAHDAQAGTYAPAELREAERLWAKAMQRWHEANDMNPLTRDYAKTVELANLSISRSREAKTLANRVRAELERTLGPKVSGLQESLVAVERMVGILPLTHELRARLTPTNLALNEVKQALRRDDLLLARNRAKKVEKSINRLGEQTHALLVDYFEDHPHWVALDQQMRQWSRQNNAFSIVVDKFARRCIVYKSGRKHAEFEVELGANWLGHKRQRGDLATPEGLYQVTARRSGAQTIYHKSLPINYPNAQDRERFARAQAAGIIPRNAHIGGSIAIHGGGGKGFDWTEGCVALENRDMDKLFAMIPVGTPVAIVGSLAPLEQIIDWDNP